jgi:mono/diheme cytochrome c family protein
VRVLAAAGLESRVLQQNDKERSMKKGIVLAIALPAALSVGLIAQSGRGQSPGAGPFTPETVRLINSIDGPELYKAYCAVCHGPAGRGGGPMADALKVPPADLTKIASRNSGVYPTALVEKIISGEQTAGAGHGTQAMPVWGPIFSQVAWDQDLGRIRIRNLADYIGKLQAR